ncbi:MAG: response regulator [Patescibacteria group bacterium]
MDKKKKILVVEDDEFLRTLYTDILSKEHYTVSHASDGNEAYAKIKDGMWDLILLDIILPYLDGIEIVLKLKKEYPDALKQRIIFLTNLDKNEIVEKIKTLGYTYIIKSDLNPEEFVKKIKGILTSQK